MFGLGAAAGQALAKGGVGQGLWSLISGPVIGDQEGGHVVRADGGRRKWWRRCRCPVVCAAHCATASCPAGLAAAGLVLQVCLAASLASPAASLAAAGPPHSPPRLMVLLL